MATTPPFHSGEVGVAYSAVALAASGGVQPYSWTVSSGALPDGLSLTSDGQVLGTPKRAGHFSFVLEVSDSAGGRASLNSAVGIAAALTAKFLKACGASGSCSVEQGCASVCGGFGYQGGGVAPYSYQLTSGTPPPGTSLYGLSLAGQFTTTGTYRFKATVTDGFGASASVTPAFTVFPHLVLTSSASCRGGYTGGSTPGCQVLIPYSGGSGVPSVKITGNVPTAPGCYSWGPPPSGSLSVAGGGVVVTIPGNIGNGYGAVWTLVVTDKNLCGPATYCSSGPSSVDIRVACS